MISFMLSVVPISKLAKLINPIITFLSSKVARDHPCVVHHRAQHSRNAGSASPKIDNVSAPNTT